MGGGVFRGHSWRACMFGSRVYPLPARTSRRLGGASVGGHGDVFSGGSPWTVTGPFFDLLVIYLLGPPPNIQFSAGVNPREQG